VSKRNIDLIITAVHLLATIFRMLLMNTLQQNISIYEKDISIIYKNKAHCISSDIPSKRCCFVQYSIENQVGRNPP